MSDEPEVLGLLALLVLTHARRPGRLDRDGMLVRLSEQDRSLWDAGMIAEGKDLVRACLRRNQPGPYQIQAPIAAVRSDASRPEETDWAQIVVLYDQLSAFPPSPVVSLTERCFVA